MLLAELSGSQDTAHLVLVLPLQVDGGAGLLDAQAPGGLP